MRGSITRRGKGYRVIVYLGIVDGNKRYKQRTVHSRSEADRLLAEMLHEVCSGNVVPANRLTTAQHLEDWLTHAKARVKSGELSKKTVERWGGIVKHLVAGLGRVKLQELKAVQINRYYHAAVMSGRKDGKGGLSAQTVIHHHRVLYSALDYAVDVGLISTNPCLRAKPPKAPRCNPDPLTLAEVKRLRVAVEGHRIHIPVQLALATGMRRGEILALDWDHVCLDKKELQVAYSMEQTREGIHLKEPKTRASTRLITLDSETVDLLRRWKAHQAEEALAKGTAYSRSGFVCTREDGSPWPPGALSNAYAKLAKNLNLHATSFHKLRHTHATLLAQEGVHVNVLKARMGHSTVTTTLAFYTGVFSSMQEQVPGMVTSAMARVASVEESNPGLARIGSTLVRGG